MASIAIAPVRRLDHLVALLQVSDSDSGCRLPDDTTGAPPDSRFVPDDGSGRGRRCRPLMIVVQGEADLSQVLLRLASARGLPSLLNRRQDQRGRDEHAHQEDGNGSHGKGD